MHILYPCLSLTFYYTKPSMQMTPTTRKTASKRTRPTSGTMSAIAIRTWRLRGWSASVCAKSTPNASSGHGARLSRRAHATSRQPGSTSPLEQMDFTSLRPEIVNSLKVKNMSLFGGSGEGLTSYSMVLAEVQGLSVWFYHVMCRMVEGLCLKKCTNISKEYEDMRFLLL